MYASFRGVSGLGWRRRGLQSGEALLRDAGDEFIVADQPIVGGRVEMQTLSG